MSEYLDQYIRTKEEALADIRRSQAKQFAALTDRMVKLCEQMQKTADELDR